VNTENRELIAQLNAHAPNFIDMLGGKVIEVDPEAGACTFEFNIGREFCHSVDVIQGGFVTAMLDATMSHAAFGQQSDIVNVATLEIKVSFLEPSRAGRFRCRGWLRKTGRSTGFMEAELFDENGLLTATATTTAKLVRRKPDGT
jgi:uncharacterized protein (TIGR00369 family)